MATRRRASAGRPSLSLVGTVARKEGPPPAQHGTGVAQREGLHELTQHKPLGIEDRNRNPNTQNISYLFGHRIRGLTLKRWHLEKAQPPATPAHTSEVLRMAEDWVQ